MFKTQQVSGPIAPMQVSGPSSYYPMQTTGTDWSSMFSSMMPMIMMIMMMAMLMPMMKGMTSSARD
jgi:ATP-dependent Zn protease